MQCCYGKNDFSQTFININASVQSGVFKAGRIDVGQLPIGFRPEKTISLSVSYWKDLSGLDNTMIWGYISSSGMITVYIPTTPQYDCIGFQTIFTAF